MKCLKNESDNNIENKNVEHECENIVKLDGTPIDKSSIIEEEEEEEIHQQFLD